MVPPAASYIDIEVGKLSVKVVTPQPVKWLGLIWTSTIVTSNASPILVRGNADPRNLYENHRRDTIPFPSQALCSWQISLLMIHEFKRITKETPVRSCVDACAVAWILFTVRESRRSNVSVTDCVRVVLADAEDNPSYLESPPQCCRFRCRTLVVNGLFMRLRRVSALALQVAQTRRLPLTGRLITCTVAPA